MVFETVYKVPSSLLEGKKEYLKKEDLENLTKHNLLYFSKQSKDHILDDYPCMGTFERRLQSSMIKGPFESAPNIEKQDVYSVFSAKVLKLLVPTSLMPVNFENVSLIEYGTQTDRNSLEHLELVARERINPKQMMGIGEKILDNLRRKCNLQQVSDSQYRASMKDCLLEFSLKQSYLYPSIEITLFGRGEIPQQFLQESGMHELGEQFYFMDRDVGIKDSRREGLAYNITLNGKNISETISSENVLL